MAYCAYRRVKGEKKQRRFLDLLKRETNQNATDDLTQGAPSFQLSLTKRVANLNLNLD